MAIDGSSIATTATALERDYARITAELAVRTTPRVHVFLYPTREALQSAVRPTVGDLPEFATGLVTGADAIHILSPNLTAVWSYLNGVENMAHELAHCVSLVINPRIANNPRWLWETVAVYEAGQFVDPRSLPYLAGGAAPSLESLNSFDNTRIYDVGYVIGEFIVSRWGRDGLIALVANNGNLRGRDGPHGDGVRDRLARLCAQPLRCLRLGPTAGDVDPAFEFPALPTSRARIRGIDGPRRAWLTPDAGVAGVVQRQQWNVVASRMVPHSFRRPVRQRTDLADGPSAGQREVRRHLELRPRWRLVAPQTGEPAVVGLQGSEERPDLVPRAARVGARFPLAGGGLGRSEIDEAQLPSSVIASRYA